MIKNDENKIIGGDNNNISNELGSRESTSPQKKTRKDGKGNLILKKEKPFKKTKYHAYLIDDLIPGKDIANVIDVESYKKYNLEDEENEEEGEEVENKKDNKLEETNVIITQGCCSIF